VREAVPGLVILDAPAWSDKERRFRVRPEVAARLTRAVAAMPENLRLGFWEGLRPVCVQHDLWSHGLDYFRCAYPQLTSSELEPLLEQYVARPSGIAPPHSTGSAVDVAAVDGFGCILTPEDSWGRMGTDLMARVLHSTGLANYAPEWWHWSYGDDEWARVYDCAPLPFSRTSREELAEGPGDGI
jgi:D-alanyl-D-alanine dipeptidase